MSREETLPCSYFYSVLKMGCALLEGHRDHGKDRKNTRQGKGQVIKCLFNAATRPVNIGTPKGAAQPGASLPLDQDDSDQRQRDNVGRNHHIRAKAHGLSPNNSKGLLKKANIN
jgi:hypothetical protein